MLTVVSFHANLRMFATISLLANANRITLIIIAAFCVFEPFRNDKRFFLKTQNKREIKFLLANLKIYMEHLRKYPHSLLVKFLGTIHSCTQLSHSLML